MSEHERTFELALELVEDDWKLWRSAHIRSGYSVNADVHRMKLLLTRSDQTILASCNNTALNPRQTDRTGTVTTTRGRLEINCHGFHAV